MGYGGLPGKGFWARIAPLGDQWATVVRAARTQHHHGWGDATARIQFPAPPRYGHHLDGSQERDLLPRKPANQDHGQLEVPLAA